MKKIAEVETTEPPAGTSHEKKTEDRIEYPQKQKRRCKKKEMTDLNGSESRPPCKKRNVKKPSSTEQIPGFLTNNTFDGFLVTLRATLQILSYLTRERNFLYLMTARLNQDNLEVNSLLISYSYFSCAVFTLLIFLCFVFPLEIFRVIRSAGGSCDHPDATRFPYLFKLLSTYSLIKAPKGSNVSNDEFFTTFCHLMDDNKVIGKEIPKMSAKDVWQLVMDHGAGDFQGDINSLDDVLQEFQEEDIQKIEHFGGYVLKKTVKFISFMRRMFVLHDRTGSR